MTAAEIAAALGDARREGRNWRCICPVHGGCSLTLRDGHRGLLVKCWASCDSAEVLTELRRRGLIAGRSEDARSMGVVVPNDDRADIARRIALARRIWDAARDARGSPVPRYLASRGITISPPLSLRWAPACPHPSGLHLPAMVARVDNIDGELIGVHRTYLRPDGSGKADIESAKAMLGQTAGGAMRLAPAAELLMAGEGIETALAAMQATAQPAWAALSTSGLVALRLPPMVRTVIICADNDANGAGERAARTAAQRWLGEGRRVRIAMPPEPGTDFADVLAERRCSRIAEVRNVAA
jgi:putative DNA primase/helicase